MEDFLAAMKISLTSFRGSRYVVRSLRDVWYDAELQAGIDKAERTFLPMIVYFGGGTALILAAVETGRQSWILPIAVIWTIVTMLLISPLIYLAFLPKPVKAHIKLIGELSEEELSRAAQQGANERAEKILKRYKFSGKNVYKD